MKDNIAEDIRILKETIPKGDYISPIGKKALYLCVTSAEVSYAKADTQYAAKCILKAVKLLEKYIAIDKVARKIYEELS